MKKYGFILSLILIAALSTGVWAAPQIKVISKTFSVSHDWDDGIEVVPEATLTYRIVFKNIGDTPAKDPVITDAIPKNTTYVLKSLKTSFKSQSAYFDRDTQKWLKDEPKNPNRVQKIQSRYVGLIPPASDAYWVEYAVKVNY